MRQFWLCIFFVTCVSVFAADYSSGNRKTDAVTSATEYTGTPKNFKNGKNVDEQAAQIPAEEKSEEEPKIVLPERADDESLKTESAMHFLPETFEEDKPTIILSDESGENEDSGIGSEMLELPGIFEEDKPTIMLPDESGETEDSSIGSEMLELPGIFEEDKPTIILSDESGETEDSGIGSEMLELPVIFEEDKPTIMLPDENGETEDSGIGSEMLELPLPNALFEEDEEKNEELPFIWDEKPEEEEPVQNKFYDEELPTLLDIPEVTLEKIEKSEAVDVPDTKILQDFADTDKSDEPEIEWVFEKDCRKLMDFNENFAGFPKYDNDVFDNPAQYQYDRDNLIVESGKKIDNLTGQRFFDSAVNYVKANENAKAAKLLKELLHYNFSVPETEYLLALAQFKSGNTDEAIKYLKRSSGKNKNPYLLAKNMELLGEIHFSQKNYDEAYRNFIAAIVGVNAKLDAQLYNKAGIAALRAGNIENARKAWKTGNYLGNGDAKRNLLWLDN